MADIIATEAQAKQVGGSSISITANKMCTQARAIECKCKNVNYPSDRLIPFKLLVRDVIDLGTIKLSGSFTILRESANIYNYHAFASAKIASGHSPGSDISIRVVFEYMGGFPLPVTIKANSSTGQNTLTYQNSTGTPGQYKIDLSRTTLLTNGFTCVFTF